MTPDGSQPTVGAPQPVRFADYAALARRPRPAPRADLFTFWWTPELAFEDTRVADVAFLDEEISAVSFARSEVTNARFERCTLNGVAFEHAMLERVEFSLTTSEHHRQPSARVAMHAAQLNEVRWFIERGVEVYFDDATLTFCDFAGDITHAGFADVTIRNSRVQFDFDTQIGSPRIEHLGRVEPVRFDGANIRNAGLYLTGTRLTFDLAELAYVDMEFRHPPGTPVGSKGFTAHEASWVHAVLHRVNLAFARMDFADFTGASLTDVQFDHAGPGNAATPAERCPWSFVSARLQEVSFRGAVLRRADFTDAELIDVDMYGADLTDALITPEQLLACRNWEYATLNASLRVATEASLARHTPTGPEGHTLS